MVTKDLGLVTAYAYAVAGGYTGTEEEFQALLGNIAIDLAEIENLSVTVTTLPAGSSATASYDSGVLSLGIPKGDKGDSGDVANVAPEFSTSTPYDEGDYVIYNDLLYKFKEAKAAGAWDSAKVEAKTVGDELTALKEDLSTTRKKMILCKSDNLIKSDSEFSDGYMSMSGSVGSDSGYQYSPKIQVSEGDVVRCYTDRGSGFALNGLRFVTAFDSNNVAQSSKGSNLDESTYTVPNGVASVVVSVRKGSDYCILLNKTTSVYIPYFDPYYVADYDFIEDALEDYSVPMVTPKGYNLLPNAESGSGAYYASGGNPVYVSDSSYNYYIVKAKKNTDYTFCSNFGARFWIVTDDNDNVIKSGAYLYVGGCAGINTGNGTKIWLSCAVSDTILSLVEGYCGSNDAMQKPSFLNNVSLLLQSGRYACSLPRHGVWFTQGIDETFYYDNMFSINRSMLNADVTLGGYPYNVISNDGVKVDTTNTTSAVNGYRVNIYDFGFNIIDNVVLKQMSIIAKNLQNCSALVIGDSQIEQGVITGDMLDSFSADGKTLTLLGTRGTAPNLTEGRAGWTAKQYCTVASSGTVTNAFWNPSTSAFDFSYYMTQQGYASVDFVIINLGGNDLYNAGVGDDQKISETAGYIFEIIDSILAYNTNQKIILNLAPATTHNDAVSNKTSMVTRNNYVRYNNMMQVLCRAYANNVHTSYTHLVVNPETDLADHIHENAGGYKKMADDLINQINCWQNA